jgi:hypothetical protein
MPGNQSNESNDGKRKPPWADHAARECEPGEGGCSNSHHQAPVANDDESLLQKIVFMLPAVAARGILL